MRADLQEVSDAVLRFEYDSVIPGDIDAPAAGERSVDRVIIEKRMERIFKKYVSSDFVCRLYLTREFFDLFLKGPVKDNPHIPRYLSISLPEENAGDRFLPFSMSRRAARISIAVFLLNFSSTWIPTSNFPSANAFVASLRTEANGTPSRFARFMAFAFIFGSMLNTT